MKGRALLDAYVTVADHHAVTVSELAKTRGKGVASTEALANAEVVEDDGKRAMAALRNHRETHGC
jgi:hypothetical protein